MSTPLYSLLSILLYLVILFTSSLFGSINTLNSSYQLFLQSLYGCIFIFFSLISIKPLLQKIVLVLCLCIAIFFFITHFFAPSLFPFLSTGSYQFILPTYGGHNHLGDLTGLVFVIVLVNPLHWIFLISLLIPLLIIMGISFSKSAFLGILGVLFVLAVQKKGVYRIGFGIMLCISAIIIGIYTSELAGIPLIQSGQKIMTQTLHLSPKPLLSSRDSYYPQVFRAWKAAPLEQYLFGYGLGNYVYSSIKTGATAGLTPTETHNILLNIFIESGFLSLFWFLIFCTLILVIGLKQKNPSLYLFLYLLINFQTDYTYVIPFFMALFFFFASQVVYKKNKGTNEKVITGIFCILVLAFALYSGTKYSLILRDKANLETKLTNAIIQRDTNTIHETVIKLEALTPYDEGNLVRWASIEEGFKNNTEAIRLLEKVSIYSPRLYLLSLSHQLELQKKAGIDIKQYLEKRKKDFALFPLSPD